MVLQVRGQEAGTSQAGLVQLGTDYVVGQQLFQSLRLLLQLLEEGLGEVGEGLLWGQR